MNSEQPVPTEQEEGHWVIRDGQALRRPQTDRWTAAGVCRLTYNNPFNLNIERVWFDGKIVYACEQGELDVDLSRVKVAQEYQIVYHVELDDAGKLRREPERARRGRPARNPAGNRAFAATQRGETLP